MDINSLEDVEDKIKNWKDKTTEKHSSGGSSGGSGGVSIPVVNTKPKEDIKPDDEKEDIKVFEFTDIDETHWAYSYVKELHEKGILAGKGNNLFAPEAHITRAEFVKILCVISDIEESVRNSKFSDVLNEAWYSGYVMAAYEKGIVKGITEDYFGVNRSVKRQDICTML